MNVAARPPGTHIAAAKLAFHRAYDPRIGAPETARMAKVAGDILREEPHLGRIPPLAPLCSRGLADAPSLLIEDHSGIQLAHEKGADRNLSYRAAMLAREGDVLAVYGERNLPFEAYCRDSLGLGDVTVLAPRVADGDQSLSRACLEDEGLLARCADIACRAGAFNVHPYMATGGVWRLAGAICKRAGVPVRVAGPGPALARAVNDKLWFTRTAALLLGHDAVPHNRTVYGMAALVGHLRRFVGRHHVVGLKLPHSAASMGNMVLESPDFAGSSSKAIAGRLAEAIDLRGWDKPFPMQITAWEGPLLGSPSVQLWIPDPADGPPIVEAVFDQATQGAAARFTGGAPSVLGEPLRQNMAHEGALLGALFQQLGFFGRCSFDAVVVGETEAEARLHWVECNGRWGGMSLPMTLANRLVGNWQKGGFLVFSHHDPGGVPRTVPQLLERCGDLLFRHGNPSGLVLLTPGRLPSGGADFLVLAQDQAAARRLSEAAIVRLSGSP